MRVGILTFHDGINYGAFFQVCALQIFLLQEGFQCQVINYKSLGFTLREYECFLNPLRYPIPNLVRNIVKIAKFKVAQRKLNLTNRIFAVDKLAALFFDRVIIGSDEVWNFRTDLIGYDPVYFSKGLKAGRIISYATSFGCINSQETIPEELKGFLNRIEYISVRDDNTANIMRKISNKPVEVVLDSVFLFNLKSQAIMPNEGGFILIYGFFNEKIIRQILDYAHSVKKKTISISYRNPWCDICLETLSPFQWLGYFPACDCVITNMYHGMLFAIINQKDFCMFITPYRKNKLGNLPAYLGLTNRIIDEDGSLDVVFNKEINYAEVNPKVDVLRMRSKEFLLKALES